MFYFLSCFSLLTRTTITAFTKNRYYKLCICLAEILSDNVCWSKVKGVRNIGFSLASCCTCVGVHNIMCSTRSSACAVDM
jgi:hypothetical protein